MGPTLLLISNDDATIQLIESVNQIYEFQFQISICEGVSDWERQVRYYHPTIVYLDFDCIEESERRRMLEMSRQPNTALSYIVLKTTYTIQEMRMYFKLGASDCISKPLNKNTLYYLLHETKARAAKEALKIEGPIRIKECLASMRSSLAYDLIFGTIKNSKDIWDRSKWADLATVPNTAMVVHIDEFFRLTKNKSKRWEQSIRSEIIEAIQQFQDHDVQEVLAIITAPDKIAVLLSVPLCSSKAEYKALATAYAGEIKAYIKERTRYTVTIGIGHCYEDARNLHVSYQEALHAQTHKFFTGTDTLLHIDDAEPFVNEMALLPGDEMDSLVNKLTVGDFAGVKQSIEQLWSIVFQKPNADPQVFKMQILDLLTTLARAALNGGAKPKDIFSIHLRYARDLHRIENTVHMKQWFKEAVEHFLECVLTNYNEQMLKSVQKAIQYIHSYYLENITLEQVASHVHLSPNYFSYIFKKTTGSSLVEYITHLRIEKAKVMLMDLNYTVYHIAGAVGYNDARYFSRVFKTIVGKTPSQYRNALLVPKPLVKEGMS
ncbi:helix-turn-helix domain-containing protein [Aneurinibacillus aneurinilyticus]|uniref:helix-turn-helix domain-containing protein n=1 Tax=Aneurinibacillus aneurinilyticus TaxID=1391 RepID=UPI0005911B50|nr:helix-turn-helix domain-containing protein [Aneurinibacillus aneurinilyticus]MCI1695526.1 AraC family transcriptional regulator [Aneurinibacillus aneurinilyticus]MED0709316.1 AraC family transcriptional regulator [Aneurinibacillus aneurinilyticus]MED0721987.1 AraC family transcriptional regulator [Aneurinibacillus aneurinilyticus]MED0734725.1 AraC family transcriptional regulator [Aneurinibacillus aneurinilyticus]MED0743492.1 AraC family transcriptional regulator [Aneurinibacillus aneurinil